jgi:hypothetical protein
MRIRTGLGVLIGCCAGLTACTATAPTGPAATVTTPAVGRPPAPVSAQAALSSEAFTPYGALGGSPDDGLAPGETYTALHAACMNDAVYGQYASSVPFSVRLNRGLAFAQAYGPWGYIGTALAAQAGFTAPEAGQSVGQGNSPGSSPVSLPAGAQAAAGKCLNIIMDFNNAQFAHSMAGIETMNDDISTDVIQDPDFKKATTAWSACMARNGYHSPDADTFAQQEQEALGLRGPVAPGSGSGPTSAQNAAQLAMATTDADCTQSTDLAGIYYAVQASYEKQFVDANQQALTVAVRQYRAAYAAELSKLPALLRTASATPALPGRPAPGQHGPGQHGPGQHGHPGHPGKAGTRPTSPTAG